MNWVRDVVENKIEQQDGRSREKRRGVRRWREGKGIDKGGNGKDERTNTCP